MRLGSLSEKYESNGDPGAISHTKGDKGGPSYGTYQLSLNSGALSMYAHLSVFKQEFKGLTLGSEEFDTVWRKLAKDHRDEFAEDQYKYHKATYFDPVRSFADSYKLPDTNAINQVLWSTSTQHGPYWTKNKIKTLQGSTEKGFIVKIYKLRKDQFRDSKYYNSTSTRKQIMNNVLKRFDKEEKEALALIQEI